MFRHTSSPLLVAAAAALAGAAAVRGAPPPVGQNPHATVVGGVRVRYLLYVPAAYGRDPERRWPLVLYLHGMGERGTDLRYLIRHPLPKLLAAKKDFPAIVVSPQLPLAYDAWKPLFEPLIGLLGRVEARYAVDPSRVYLTGLSMGGFGTWELGMRNPERFAALVPIAGGWRFGTPRNPAGLCRLRDTPLWAFHGAADEIVPAERTKVFVEELRACGGEPRLTLYPGVGHEGSWTRAYASAALWRWLFAQRRG